MRDFARWISFAVLCSGCGLQPNSRSSAESAASIAATSAAVVKVFFNTFQDASLVIGQPDFISVGGGGGSSTFGNLYGEPYFNGSVLYLPDYGRNRILGYNGIPTVNGAAADFVLGQPDFVTNLWGNSSTQMNGVQTVMGHQGKLLALEYGGDRISVWNAAPSITEAAADYVIGWTGFDSSPNVTCTATTMDGAESMYISPAGKLLVADSHNDRVLIWNSVPTSSGVPADLVLGQTDLTTCTPSVGGVGMDYPSGIWSNDTRVIIADASNNRVLIWNSFPVTNNQPPDLILGQPDSTTITPGSTAASFDFPYFLESNGEQLFVADNENNRVLIWNEFPTTHNAPADVVLGQSNFTANVSYDDNQDLAADGMASARTLGGPSGLRLIGNRLFVSDNGANRYLIFEGSN